MFEAITRLFRDPEPKFDEIDTRLAVAALLVHLAAVDGVIKPEERRAIEGVLQDHYGLDHGAVARLMEDAQRRDAESVDLYKFTSELSGLPEADRLEIIRMLWTVVFSDDSNHELEDNVVWRIAELIHIPARERTMLRKQMSRSSSK